VHESACPVIALIHAPDPDFVKEASKRGVFAYITDADAKDWQSSIDIVLRRFAEVPRPRGRCASVPPFPLWLRQGCIA
jgi:AmiR/NasT family two-component response regulator